MAAVIFTICKKAIVPSCIRVPPETGAASSGSPSAVARSIAMTRRSAAATPIDPAKNPNSHAITATRRPWISPSPVMTASSTPLLPRALASSSAYACVAGTVSGGVSHRLNEPSSGAVSIS